MIELCGRTKNGGGKCESPALRGKSFCYFHDPKRQRRAGAVKVRYFLELTMLETEGTVRAAISETVQALARKEIDIRHGGKLLYALQLAWNGKSTGKKQGTSPASHSSRRYLKIARAPGFTKIYSTGGQPDGGNLGSPRPVQLQAVNAVSTPATSWNGGVYL
jgi:hypothetical protein